MTAQVFKDGIQAGMRINACFYLSDGPADGSRQNAPSAWKDMSLAETTAQVEQYTFAATTYLLEQGITVDLYDVGNETLIGLLGFRPGQRIVSPTNLNPYFSPSYLTASVWPTEAKLFTAAIHGIRRADPNARVALHVESTAAPAMDTVYAFFKQMNTFGVPYDIAGISLPYVDGTDLSQYTAAEYFQRWNVLVNRIASLGKPVAVAEKSYPWRNAGEFYPPMADYPYTPEGQRAFLNDQLTWASNNDNIISWDWFYPEWYPGINGGSGEPAGLVAQGLLSDSQTLLPAAAALNFNIGNTSIPSAFSVVGSANFSPGALAPGELVSLFGANLSGDSSQASNLPLSDLLGGVEVTVGGLPAPLIYVSPGQINFQIPFEATPGTAAIVVNSGYARAASYRATVAASAPQIFTHDANRAIVQNPDLSLNDPSHPAHPGDVLTVYATGEGQVTPPVETGAPAPSSPLAKATLPVAATIGSLDAGVAFAGLTPGTVGLFQVNVVVPSLPPGDYTLQVTVGVSKSNSPLVTSQ